LISLARHFSFGGRRVCVRAERRRFTADDARQGLTDPDRLARSYENPLDPPADGRRHSGARVDHGLDPPGEPGFGAPSPTDADHDQVGGLGLGRAQSDEAFRRFGLAFVAGFALGMSALFFSVTRLTLGGGWSGVRRATTGRG